MIRQACELLIPSSKLNQAAPSAANNVPQNQDPRMAETAWP